MPAYRAALLYFSADHQLVYESDGLLVTRSGEDGVQRVSAVGAWSALAHAHRDEEVRHWPGRIIAPGFVDLHIHYPQVDVIASPAEGLLPWLENYTFVQEARFADPAHAAAAASFFLDELQRHGVTTALTFCSSHPESVDALMTAAQARRLRLIAGKCLMDRNAPDGVRDETERSLLDTEALLGRWHGRDRLGYAITPRFVPSCSDAQLAGAGELARRYTDYTGSAQAVMAADTLLNALVSSGQVDRAVAARLRPSLDRAYAQVRDPNSYRPDAFRESLTQVAQAARSLR